MNSRGNGYNHLSARGPIDLLIIKNEILDYFSKPSAQKRRAANQQSVHGVRGPQKQMLDDFNEDVDEFSLRQDLLFVEKFLSTQVFIAYLN
tara:strand:+ start:2444 stop:2716 length:273 start_codon:yes stop_codon:yes gene_type:complete